MSQGKMNDEESLVVKPKELLSQEYISELLEADEEESGQDAASLKQKNNI